MRRLVTLLLLLVVGSLVLSGCDFDVYKLPLPGGADLGSHPITVTADFEDVLDLVPKSTVKVDDVTVGEVTDVSLQGQHAVVTMKLRGDTMLPDNAVADIQQTSLLGEKFVALSSPAQGATGRLSNGDVIPLSHTGRDPQVEEVLGALSLILNGGGIAQLKTIASSLNQALTGHEDAARSLLTQVQTFTTTLDDHKGDIVNAIDALNRLSISVQKQEGNIDQALDQLPGALKSINGQRADLVKMLQALDQLSNVGVRVISASKLATIDSVKQLQPVLTELADSGSAFVNAFNVFLTYPFVDEVVGRDPQVARNLQMGDYTNLSVDLQIDLSKSTLPTQLPTDLPTAITSAVSQCLAHVQQVGPSGLQDPVCTSLAGTSVLQQYCASHPGVAICTLLGSTTLSQSTHGHLPSSLPTTLPSGLPTALPTSTSSGGLLGGVTGGLGRAAPFGQHGPTMGQMEQLFDPGLVSLLVPPMVSDTVSSAGSDHAASHAASHGAAHGEGTSR